MHKHTPVTARHFRALAEPAEPDDAFRKRARVRSRALWAYLAFALTLLAALPSPLWAQEEGAGSDARVLIELRLQRSIRSPLQKQLVAIFSEDAEVTLVKQSSRQRLRRRDRKAKARETSGSADEEATIATSSEKTSLPPERNKADEESVDAPENAAPIFVVEASRVRKPRRLRLLRLRYLDAADGTVLLEGEHILNRERLDARAAARLRREIRLLLTNRDLRVRAQTRADDVDEDVRAEDETREPGGEEEEAVSRLHIELEGGAGVGTRSFSFPLEPNRQRLSTKAFAVAEIAGALRYQGARWPVFADMGLRYQTSLGLRLDDLRIDGSTRSTAARSHRLTVTFGVGAYPALVQSAGFAASAGAPAKGKRSRPLADYFGYHIQVGWAIRFLHIESPILLPDYSLSGPFVRPMLFAALGSPVLRLELGPEIQWISLVSRRLRNEGLSDMGAALGLRVGLRWRFHAHFAALATYSESHALLKAQGRNARDRIRFATLGIVYQP